MMGNIVFSLIIYGILLFLLYEAIRSEKVELDIANAGVAALSSGTNGNLLDMQVLFERIVYSSFTDVNYPIIRRCYIISLIVTIVILYFAIGHLPDGKTLLFTLVIIFVFVFAILVFYRDRIPKVSQSQIRGISKFLFNKLNLPDLS